MQELARNLLEERDPALGIEVERTLRSEQLIQTLQMQVHLLEQRLAERERRVAALEEQALDQRWEERLDVIRRALHRL